jgi:heparanase
LTEAINLPGENMTGTLKALKTSRRISKVYASMAATALGLVAVGQAAGATISPSTLSQLTTIDERFQSYNVEMAEVIGGNFWKPYAGGQPITTGKPITTFEIGKDPAMFEKRPPIDLANARLRKLAAALGPAYVRVSGTWANSVFFQDTDAVEAGPTPSGYQSVLTRAQWAGVVAFTRAVDAKLVTSFAISSGVRDAEGIWTPAQAKPLVAYTKSIGGTITAAELFNEPTIAASGGAPDGYTALAYARDEAAFRSFIKTAAPELQIVGPGSVGEGGVTLFPKSVPMLHSADLLGTDPKPKFDVFSYHYYGAVSKRCEATGPGLGTTVAAALSEQWLSQTEGVFDFYKPLHAKYAPGTPIWITETADAACGGNPWGSTFLDTFRYVDQMGRLAKRGVKAIFHNTLASSEYGLIDQTEFRPRPNYWAALLWRRLMGTVVLDAVSPWEGLHLYAQCLRGHPGGVTLLAINNSRTDRGEITLPIGSVRYTLSAPTLQSASVMLNGQPLKLEPNDDLPEINGRAAAAGPIQFAPATVTFLAIPEAANTACAAFER